EVGRERQSPQHPYPVSQRVAAWGPVATVSRTASAHASIQPLHRNRLLGSCPCRVESKRNSGLCCDSAVWATILLSGEFEAGPTQQPHGRSAALHAHRSALQFQIPLGLFI